MTTQKTIFNGPGPIALPAEAVDAGDAVSKGYVDAATTTALAAARLAPTVIKTASYAAAVGELVLADATAAAFTITLPAAAVAGAAVTVKRVDATDHPVIVQVQGGGLVDGDTEIRLVGQRAAARFVADRAGGWRVEATAVFDTAPAPSVNATRTATAAAVALGQQGASQTAFTVYQIPAIAVRGLVSLIQVDADDPKATFDLEVRGANGGLWLQAIGATGSYRNPTCWYVESENTGDALLLGVRNTTTTARTFTLTALRVERFA